MVVPFSELSSTQTEPPWSSAFFCVVVSDGTAASWNASLSFGVRPAFLIY